MENNEFEDMYPQFRGYTGDIEASEKGSFLLKGKFKRIDDEHIEITELPIKKWTQDYKTFLEE